MTSIPVPQKKRGRPATGETPRVGVRLHPDVRRALEDVMRDPDVPVANMSEAMRFAIEAWLVEHGYLKSMPYRLGRHSPQN